MAITTKEAYKRVLKVEAVRDVIPRHLQIDDYELVRLVVGDQNVTIVQVTMRNTSSVHLVNNILQVLILLNS